MIDKIDQIEADLKRIETHTIRLAVTMYVLGGSITMLMFVAWGPWSAFWSMIAVSSVIYLLMQRSRVLR